jgi:hypothetical protein
LATSAMTGVSFDRDSLIFTARRLPDGVEIEAEFQALKVSNPDEGLRYYSVTLLIDPKTRGVSGRNWTVPRGKENSAHEGGKDKLRSLEKQVRDEVLKYPAWDLLAQRAPDPNYVVDELGRVVKRDPPILRRF